MRTFFFVVAAAAFLAGCQIESGKTPEQIRQAELQAMKDQARAEVGALRFVVDKSERALTVYRGPEAIFREDVAVGAPEWETPSGAWTLDRVDINPEWNPPDSPWAADEVQRAPGDPENPMGQARLVFNMPYTIHGTNDVASLGQAASHGSIRISNPNVIALAELLLKAGGAWEGRAWFDQMVASRTTQFQLELAHPAPIEVQD